MQPTRKQTQVPEHDGQRSATRVADALAATLSGVCVIHCLALPIIAGVLPILSTVADVDWVHKVLVIMAIPISGYAMIRHAKLSKSYGLVALAGIGLILLFSAAFFRALHEYETVITTIGAVLLGSVHLRWWFGGGTKAHDPYVSS